MLCIKNGLVYTIAEKEPFKGDVLIEDGKICAVGADLEIPEGTEVIDAEGLEVYPGFVEAHCHTGLDGYGIGYEGRACSMPGVRLRALPKATILRSSRCRT